MECKFVILMASQFNSGFGKADFASINIGFKTKKGEKLKKFGEIASSIIGKERERDSFFYLFINVIQKIPRRKEKLITRRSANNWCRM